MWRKADYFFFESFGDYVKSKDWRGRVDRNKRIALVLWLGSTALLEWVAYAARHALFGVPGAEQALVMDEAFMLLLYLAIPVFTLVWVMLGVSMVKFRDRGDREAAGDNQQSAKFHRGWAWSWLIWSSCLCVFVMVHPGWTGLQELRSTSDKTPDLTIEVTGQRWAWMFYYKDHDVMMLNPKENLVLPNDSLIRFMVTARDSDVLHSFWIPAFRQKIDAVPGLITSVDVTTNRIGSYAEDSDYRVQCAELCGVGHSVMSQPVQVVEKSEFADWIAGKRE